MTVRSQMVHGVRLRSYNQQKAALTRAVGSGDPKAVLRECRQAVLEWNEPGECWPDDWNRWQLALNDAFVWPNQPQLDQL